ncbi:MAG: TnpV protein [Oscillospiraceae bacterium]|nr:TnpV protein [Oscillospiraceae bacterium]
MLHTQLLFSGKLSAHLEEINRHAETMMDQLMTQMAAQEGITEQLKAKNQMEWVMRINSIRSRAEEIVWDELTN